MVSKIVITESFLLEAFSTLSSPKRVLFVTPKCDFKTFYQIVKYLISSKWYRKKRDETHFLFSAEVTVESVFTVTQWTIWFETLQASEKSEENEMLQKTHKYTMTYSSLKSGLCGAPFVSYFPWSFQRAMLVYQHAMGRTPIWQPEINKDIWIQFFDKNDLFSLWSKL